VVNAHERSTHTTTTTKELKMKKLVLFTATAIALVSTGAFSNAFAQETRAQVRQELVQAENNGSRFVTDTSYPDVSPIYTAQVERLRQKSSDSGDVGGRVSGSTASGTRTMPGSMSCVGPASFCSTYFGS
jgi:hypothetical protein